MSRKAHHQPETLPVFTFPETFLELHPSEPDCLLSLTLYATPPTATIERRYVNENTQTATEWVDQPNETNSETYAVGDLLWDIGATVHAEARATLHGETGPTWHSQSAELTNL